MQTEPGRSINVNTAVELLSSNDVQVPLGLLRVDEKGVKMLEVLFFRIGGYFEGNRMLIVCNHDGCLSLDYFLLLRRNRASIPHFHATWAKQRSQRWSSKFAALHCEEWKDQYCDYSILDGAQWELRFKLEGQDERQISGSNAYPENRDSFLRWISDAVHQLPAEENIDVDQAADVVFKLTSAIKK